MSEFDQYTCVNCAETFLVYTGIGPRYCPCCGQLTIRFVSTEELERKKTELQEKYLLQKQNPYFKGIMEVIQEHENKHNIY